MNTVILALSIQCAPAGCSAGQFAMPLGRTFSPAPRTSLGCSTMTRPHEVQAGLASLISRAFTQATFDLSARPGADEPGWAQLPECLFATALEGAGEPASFIRGALTLIAAMDRSRAAVNLWRCALTLHERDRWAFVPTEVAIHSLTALTDALRESGVSQRHLPDAAAWRRIAELLLEERVSPVARVISEGIGDAVKLLDALGGTTREERRDSLFWAVRRWDRCGSE